MERGLTTMEDEMLVAVRKIGKVLIDYIGSEDFEKAVSCLRDDTRSAFMAGIGMAGCLILSECPTYIRIAPEEAE